MIKVEFKRKIVSASSITWANEEKNYTIYYGYDHLGSLQLPDEAKLSEEQLENLEDKQVKITIQIETL